MTSTSTSTNTDPAPAVTPAGRWTRETGTPVAPGLLPPGSPLPGGGMRGRTDTLDALAVDAAGALSRVYPGAEVVLRFNSDRLSGGAWLAVTGPDGIRRTSGLGIRVATPRRDGKPDLTAAPEVSVLLDRVALRDGAGEALTAAGHPPVDGGTGEAGRSSYRVVPADSTDDAARIVARYAVASPGELGAAAARARERHLAGLVFVASGGSSARGDGRFVSLPGLTPDGGDVLERWSWGAQGRRSGPWQVSGAPVAVAALPVVAGGGPAEPGRVYRQGPDGTYRPSRVVLAGA